MKRLDILGKELLDEAKNIEFHYNKEGSLYEIYDQLLKTYCYPIRGLDQYNLILGSGYEERYWKWKRIQEAKKKRESDQVQLDAQQEEEIDYKKLAKKLVDLVDDAAISSTKNINQPSENLVRELILRHPYHFYLDVCEQLYYALIDQNTKEELIGSLDTTTDQDFIETMYDFTKFVLYMERLTQEDIEGELSEALKELAAQVRNNLPKYLSLLMLDEISILMFNERAVKVEEQEEYRKEASDQIRKAVDIMTDFTDTVNEVYVAFSELMYGVIFDRAKGNEEKMTSLLKSEIEQTKKILKIEKKENQEQLGCRIFCVQERTQEDTLYQVIASM